jgi:uncharacterized protein YdhG (YjbR/CyaY superfamily)
MKMKTYTSIDAVIKDAPKKMQPILKKLRATIRKAAPKAEEAIRYGMPTFRLNGKNLVYFMYFKKHLGFFPGRGGIESVVKAAKRYQTGKGALRFELDAPVPYGLVTTIVKRRVKEVSEPQRRKAKSVRA